MDALRKAEAEKKAATERVSHSEVAPSVSASADELRLEPLAELSGEFSHRDPADTQRLSVSARFRRSVADATLADEVPFDRSVSGGYFGVEGETRERPEFVTAHTIFAANPRPRRNPMLLALGGLTVLAVVGIATLGYQYYRTLPAPHAMPSPRVADAVTAIHPEVAPPRSPPPTAPVTPVPTLGPVIKAPLPPPSIAVITAPAPPTTPADTPAIKALPRAPEIADQPSPPKTAKRAPASDAFDAEITSGQVRIAHAAPAEREPTRRALTHAYAAFVAGDLSAAKAGYQRVLATHPRQIDAWLGLGAIALANNQLTEAQRDYQQVLAEQSEHPVAIAALELIESGARDGSEARLKLLLDRGIDAPYLHFALGNLYARHARWPDAQAAFFNALRGSPNNADYAYNLAVALEHLQQPKVALAYYQKAKQSAGRGRIAFNPALVEARISALTSSTTPLP